MDVCFRFQSGSLAWLSCNSAVDDSQAIDSGETDSRKSSSVKLPLVVDSRECFTFVCWLVPLVCSLIVPLREAWWASWALQPQSCSTLSRVKIAQQKPFTRIHIGFAHKSQPWACLGGWWVLGSWGIATAMQQKFNPLQRMFLVVERKWLILILYILLRHLQCKGFKQTWNLLEISIKINRRTSSNFDSFVMILLCLDWNVCERLVSKLQQWS